MILMGYAYETAHIIRCSYFEHLVFDQMLYFVAADILILHLSDFVPMKFVVTNECLYISYYVKNADRSAQGQKGECL